MAGSGRSLTSEESLASYSGALKQILTAKSRIFIDVLILSEFVNRYARLVQQVTPKWKRKHTKKW